MDLHLQAQQDCKSFGVATEASRRTSPGKRTWPRRGRDACTEIAESKHPCEARERTRRAVPSRAASTPSSRRCVGACVRVAGQKRARHGLRERLDSCVLDRCCVFFALPSSALGQPRAPADKRELENRFAPPSTRRVHTAHSSPRVENRTTSSASAAVIINAQLENGLGRSRGSCLA